MNTMTTLITGVTGGLGAAILENLSKSVPASDIAVLVRSAKKDKCLRKQAMMCGLETTLISQS